MTFSVTIIFMINPFWNVTMQLNINFDINNIISVNENVKNKGCK